MRATLAHIACGLFIVTAALCWADWPAQSHLLDKRAVRQVAELLRQQHYAWDGDVHYRLYYVGRIRVRAGTYWIYYDDLVNPEDQHGLQNVVILQDGRHLVGVYSLTSTDQGVPIIARADILFRSVDSLYGNRIHFDENGPPQEAWVDGYNIPFDVGGRGYIP